MVEVNDEKGGFSQYKLGRFWVDIEECGCGDVSLIKWKMKESSVSGLSH